MILFRDRPATHTFLKEWLDYLTDGNKMYVSLGNGAKAIMGDQLAFNSLVTQGSHPWKAVDTDADARVVWASNRRVKVPLCSPCSVVIFFHLHLVYHLSSC